MRKYAYDISEKAIMQREINALYDDLAELDGILLGERPGKGRPCMVNLSAEYDQIESRICAMELLFNQYIMM